MGTLYINRTDIELKSEGQAMVIYESGQRQNSIPIKMIERLVIQHTTRLDTNLLLKLAEAGASVLLLSSRYSQRVAILLGPRHNDAAIRLAQAIHVATPKHNQGIAQQIISSKIKRQIRVLRQALIERPDARKPLFDGLNRLQEIHNKINASTPDHQSLRGYEGAAARSYYHAYGAILPPSLNFTDRNRRPPRDPVNVCLSLAYTLLHHDAVRSAHMAGLDPLLGFYHQPSFGRESLASDLIEPLRPMADEWVWQQFSTQSLRNEHFSYDKGACLLGKAGREHFYTSWEKHANTHRRWLRIQSTALANNLRSTGLPMLAQPDIEIDWLTDSSTPDTNQWH